jgi:DNA polymerase I
METGTTGNYIGDTIWMSIIISNITYNAGDRLEGGTICDKLEVVGMESRRSDASQLSRNLQKTMFDMLLRQDKPKDEILRYIGSEIDRVRKGEFKYDEIGIPKGVNKDLSEYGKMILVNGKFEGERKGVPGNIRAIKYAKQYMGLELSSKPKMLYVSKMPEGYQPTDVLCFDEDNQVPHGTVIDIEKMLEKIVKDKIRNIFDALGWKLSALDPHWKGKAPVQGQQLQLGLESELSVKK